MRSKSSSKNTERHFQRLVSQPIGLDIMDPVLTNRRSFWICISGGYLNESGVINTRRLQMVLDALATFEEQAFEKDHSDKNWFKGKQRPKQLETLAERGGKGAFSKPVCSPV
jgi:5'-3' exonuclease